MRERKRIMLLAFPKGLAVQLTTKWLEGGDRKQRSGTVTGVGHALETVGVKFTDMKTTKYFHSSFIEPRPPRQGGDGGGEG